MYSLQIIIHLRRVYFYMLHIIPFQTSIEK
jgi:hypothetical protein